MVGKILVYFGSEYYYQNKIKYLFIYLIYQFIYLFIYPSIFSPISSPANSQPQAISLSWQLPAGEGEGYHMFPQRCQVKPAIQPHLWLYLPSLEYTSSRRPAIGCGNTGIQTRNLSLDDNALLLCRENTWNLNDVFVLCHSLPLFFLDLDNPR